MKAMIFAAGIGSRLRPLTDTMPKAMVDIHGRMMVDRAIDRLKSVGVTSIVVNVHHHAATLKEHLSSIENVIVSDESNRLLDTGGGVLAASEMLEGDEPILLYNADILTDVDFADFASYFNRCGSVAVLLTDNKRSSTRKLLFDDRQTMKGWINETSGSVRPEGMSTDGLHGMAFNGLHIVSPAIFPLLRDYADRNGDVFSITSFYIDVCDRCRISAYTPNSEYQWFDIGSVEKLETARANFVE